MKLKGMLFRLRVCEWCLDAHNMMEYSTSNPPDAAQMYGYPKGAVPTYPEFERMLHAPWRVTGNRLKVLPEACYMWAAKANTVLYGVKPEYEDLLMAYVLMTSPARTTCNSLLLNALKVVYGREVTSSHLNVSGRLLMALCTDKGLIVNANVLRRVLRNVP